MKDKSFYRAYDVRFAGIGHGKHDHFFNIQTGFLKHYDPEFEDNIDVHLLFSITKITDIFYELEYNLKGIINFHCDRCLNSIHYPIESINKMFLKIVSSPYKEEDEDIIFASPYDYTINIADYIHDFILLQIPLRKTCEMTGNTCEPDMLIRLEQLRSSGNNPAQNETLNNNNHN